ncbi:MAG: lamin tail domain-containing protein, partial [Planctomycetota bacterium]
MTRSLFVWLCGFSILAVPQLSRADCTVVFNEIMYHPVTEEAKFEWVELYNQMAVDMDLGGWSLSGAIFYQFPEGTILEGGEYLVVASSPADLAVAGLSGALGP